jgi:hypothetical protein
MTENLAIENINFCGINFHSHNEIIRLKIIFLSNGSYEVIRDLSNSYVNRINIGDLVETDSPINDGFRIQFSTALVVIRHNGRKWKIYDTIGEDHHIIDDDSDTD